MAVSDTECVRHGGIMFKNLYPKSRAVSSYEIDYEGKYLCGYRGIIFDIDNTLVGHGADADKRSVELIRHITELGFRVCFLSNNKEPRVRRFCDGLEAGGVNMSRVFHISKAGKPSVKNYCRAMELMKTDKSTTLFVGDQLFTDVWGANRAGISSVLVNRLNNKEEIQIVLKRIPEKAVMSVYSGKKWKAASKKALVLIGFMGCGKSTIGRKISESWGYRFLDMDELIERQEKMSVSEIFASKGEEYFRKLETEAIGGKFCDFKGCVISTGGGLPMKKENHALLKKCGLVVYLKTKPETVMERLKDDTTRPLLQRPDKEAAIRTLMSEREPVYSRLADITVLTDGKKVEQIMHEIRLAL